ncbi:MAG: DUF4296 domain-containing protein [Candidatus Cryptobacteroides sp.]
MSRRFAAYLFLVLCLASACKERERVIPKNKFAEIYAEMFVLDQWLDENREVRRSADTSLVYAPVLGKYGYTYDDYLASVDEYMKDPMRYSRILRSTSEILNSRLEELKSMRDEQIAREKAAHHLDSLIRSVNFNMDSVLMEMMRSHPTDSIVAVADSDGFLSFRFVTVCDTVYDGPGMVLRDSLEVADSLAGTGAEAPVAETSPADSAVVENPLLPDGHRGRDDRLRNGKIERMKELLVEKEERKDASF